MLGSYALLTLYRSAARHRLYAAINVLGLALGVAVFLVLMLVVRFQTSFEQWIPHADQIYVIHTRDVLGNWYPRSFGGLLDELRGDYPDVVGTQAGGDSATVRQGATVTREQVTWADTNFFKVFDLPLVAGDKARLLQSPDDLVITQNKARQYFGAANPLGQRLTLDFDKRLHDYRVVGVIKDPPPTTDLNVDFLVPLETPTPEENSRWRDWGRMATTTYLRFASPAQAEALSGGLESFIHRHTTRKNTHLRLTPLLKMHLILPPAEAIVAATAAVAVLTLLLAAVNYVNLSTARASMRAKEVALRKVMGSTRRGLIAQFVGESVVTALCGALIGLAICELALPLFSTAIGVTLKLDYVGDPWLTGMMALVVLVVGVGAGVYPAFVLSRFQAASVLASTRSPGGGRAGSRLREALVILQFAIGIGFTIGMAVIVSQADYLHRADLGFRRQGLIEVDSFPHPEVTLEQRASLLTAWRAESGVIAAAQADGNPGYRRDHIAPFQRAGAPGDGPIIHFASIGPGFLQTYGARLLAGRLPDPSRAGDFSASQDLFTGSPPDDAGAINIVLNVQALRALGFRGPREAVGQLLNSNGKRFMVIGVVSDMRFHSPHEKIEPIIYWSFSGGIEGGEAAIRYAGVDTDALMARMAADWRRIVPTEPFEAKTVVAKLEPYYQTDEQISRMLTLAAVLAVAIGCIGLYGLASFNTAQRTREIGIRKTLGASTFDILRLLMGQFLRPVLLANLAAWPLAYLALRRYLLGFDQRIALTPAYFLAASAATLAIAVATVAAQALLVARAPPAKALRHD